MMVHGLNILEMTTIIRNFCTIKGWGMGLFSTLSHTDKEYIYKYNVILLFDTMIFFFFFFL